MTLREPLPYETEATKSSRQFAMARWGTADLARDGYRFDPPG